MTRSPAEPILSRRALNRALLARQFLVERQAATPIEAIEHLVAMQSQVPNAPYFGLWSRLKEFTPAALSTLLEKRGAVRMGVMRNTLHLMSARDSLAMWPLFQPLLAQRYRSTHFARDLAGIDLAALIEEATRLLSQQPRTFPQLGEELRRRFPRHPAASLAWAIRHLVPLVQVPPRGIWGKGGQATWTTLEQWLGRPPRAKGSMESLVRRYLAAFGPASAADMGMWSGLTGMQRVMERLSDRLQTFRDERGRQLFDLHDAPRPDPRTPVPPRFLPEFDNILLGHHDRTRVIAVEHRYMVGDGTFLLDGEVAGTWAIVSKKGAARLLLSSFRPLSTAERKALGEEGSRLLAFAAGSAQSTVEFAVAAPRPSWQVR